MGSPAQFPSATAGLGSVSLNAGTNRIGAVRIVDGSDNANASGFPLYVANVAGSAVIGKVKIVDASSNDNDSTHPLYVQLLAASKTNLQVGGSDVSNSVPVPVSDAGGSLTVDFDNTVGGKKLQPTGTFDTSAYSIGDVFGGKITISNFARTASRPVRLVGIKLDSDTVMTQTIYAYIFTSDPSAGTYTNNGAFSFNSSDRAKCACIVRLNDVLGDSGGSIHQAMDLNRIIDLGSGTTAYMILVLTAAVTLGANTDITLELTVEQG